MKKQCAMCGVYIDINEWQCPHCQSQQHHFKTHNDYEKSTCNGVYELNLKEGKPSVKEALNNLSTFLSNIPSGVIKIIHGYGSTGKGGAINIACHKKILKLEQSNKIRGFIKGENIYLYGKRPQTYNDKQHLLDEINIQIQDVGNPGITFLVL